jgi:hypothetical protein
VPTTVIPAPTAATPAAMIIFPMVSIIVGKARNNTNKNHFNESSLELR